MSVRRTAAKWVGGAVLAVAVIALARALAPADSVPEQVLSSVLTTGYASSVLRLTVPIAFAALGGLFAERSGVINIGIEGFLILAGLSSVVALKRLPWVGVEGTTAVWLAFLVGVLVSVLAALVFAVFAIRYRSDQVIAGLAIWLVSLGLAPFVMLVLFETSTTTVDTLGTWTVPGLAALPVVGPVLFEASPVVYMLLVAAPVSWYVLRYTRFGRLVRASGENPQALDTAGVDVHRVRYTAVVLSGVLCGVGGAGFTLQRGAFVAIGETSIGGRGFLGIVAYLFGNYNPLGALGGATLFAGFDSFQLRLQQIQALDVPTELFGALPFVVVLVTLALISRTRIPSAVGEHYDSDD